MKLYFVILVRLVGGGSYNEGRLEVCYNNRCGTICYDGWNNQYASLVCAQLGFGPLGEPADFRLGNGAILLEIVMCTLNDTFPFNCSHYGIGITVGCNHYKDIGIKCKGTLVYGIVITIIIIIIFLFLRCKYGYTGSYVS